MTQRKALIATLALAIFSAAPAQAQSWWKPVASSTFQLQLAGTVDTHYAVNVYDVDMVETPASTFAALHARGIKVVCYFSAGSAEDYRSDFKQFTAADKGRVLAGWPHERWVDTRSANVRAIMKARMDFAVSKGCDGVDPDNVDGYTNNTGFPLTAATQLDYLKFLAAEAHSRGLAVALKNDVDQLAALAPLYDMAVNEQCNQYNECGGYAAFTALNKPVFNVEYARKYRFNTNGARDALCTASKAKNIRTLVMPLSLNNVTRFSCD